MPTAVARWASEWRRHRGRADRRKGLYRVPLLRVLAIGLLLTAVPTEGNAHGNDHPTDLRNARNQFTHLEPLKRPSLVPLLAEENRIVDLQAFRGQLVLLNLWATWCPPCLEELPALDRLQARFADTPLRVVPVSIDEGAIERPISFVRRLGLRNLQVYQDFSGRVQDEFALYGLPITYLVDRQGRVRGYIVGATAWDSPEAIRFLQHYLRAGNAAADSG